VTVRRNGDTTMLYAGVRPNLQYKIGLINQNGAASRTYSLSITVRQQ
jgi:hypothetical protein